MKGIILTSLLAISPVTAFAQQNCAPREQVVQQLSEKYGETRQSIGLAANNAVMEVFANLEGGSWTITVTMTNGITCMVASGQAFENTAEAPAAKGDPA